MAKPYWIALSLGLLAGFTLPCQAAGPDPIPLWPQGAPGAQGTDAKDTPEIRLYPVEASKANGCCVVVLPGGGYGALAVDHEGQQVAKWLNSIGVTAAVVNYRLGPKYHHPAPLQDAQRGIRYVRAHAEELKIDPQRVGIMGFSAGGHLASTVSTHFDAGDKASSDPVAQQSSRPDFSILCYPVISLKESFAHAGSRRNLLGEEPDPALVENLSNETQVTKETPPTFIFQTDEDRGVPAENAVAYYLALRKQGVPAELHVYQFGPHGVGLATGNPILTTWKERLADWLKANHFLTSAKRTEVQGNVEFDGQPVRRGVVTFVPKDPNCPTVAAVTSQGKFHLASQAGPAVGEHQVLIYALGDVALHPTIEEATQIAGPEKGLMVEAVPGKNFFEFELK